MALVSDDKTLVVSAEVNETRLWRIDDGALLDVAPGGAKVVADGAIRRLAIAKGSSAFLQCASP